MTVTLGRRSRIYRVKISLSKIHLRCPEESPSNQSVSTVTGVVIGRVNTRKITKGQTRTEEGE